MRSVDDLKKLLGKAAENYTPGQLEQLRREVYGLAEWLVQFYLFKIRQRKPATTTFDRVESAD